MRRLASQRGITVPTALWVTVVMMLLALAASATAISGLSSANRDRHSKRALEAADAGLDAAIYRMNKAVVSDQLVGLLGVSGLTPTLLRELGCIDVNLSAVSLVSNGQWCTQVSGTSESLGDTASYSYRVKFGVTVGVGTLPSQIVNILGGSPTNVVKRSIVSQGTSGGVQRRVLGVVMLALNSSGNALGLWKQVAWVECRGVSPGPNPDSGCAATGVPAW